MRAFVSIKSQRYRGGEGGGGEICRGAGLMHHLCLSRANPRLLRLRFLGGSAVKVSTIGK